MRLHQLPDNKVLKHLPGLNTEITLDCRSFKGRLYKGPRKQIYSFGFIALVYDVKTIKFSGIYAIFPCMQTESSDVKEDNRNEIFLRLHIGILTYVHELHFARCLFPLHNIV